MVMLGAKNVCDIDSLEQCLITDRSGSVALSDAEGDQRDVQSGTELSCEMEGAVL
jgi:hypothetical protein